MNVIIISQWAESLHHFGTDKKYTGKAFLGMLTHLFFRHLDNQHVRRITDHVINNSPVYKANSFTCLGRTDKNHGVVFAGCQAVQQLNDIGSNIGVSFDRVTHPDRNAHKLINYFRNGNLQGARKILAVFFLIAAAMA
ncbi:hypothetical protein [Pantoea sp. App145]|uniref:hypothetical protein n=1 Tax=Pantoea sp. App145 TaxID=3071567 RepID=UPI003A7F705D